MGNEQTPVEKPEITAEMAELLDAIKEGLLGKKAERIVRLDVRGLTSVADFMFVCHATTDIQVKAIANSVIEATREIGDAPWRKEGASERRWVVLDYINVVVHIFLEELREYYNMERVWNDAEIEHIVDEPAG